MNPSPAEDRCCGSCRHFDNAPESLEAAFPGLTAMGSGHASVRAADGLCQKRGLYLPPQDLCGKFTPNASILLNHESPSQNGPGSRTL